MKMIQKNQVQRFIDKFEKKGFSERNKHTTSITLDSDVYLAGKIVSLENGYTCFNKFIEYLIDHYLGEITFKEQLEKKANVKCPLCNSIRRR